MTIPHPFPYQGSKRNIASKILQYFPMSFNILYEPFSGSGALTIAAASRGLGEKYYLNDLNKPLIDLLELIVNEPEKISDQYEKLWFAQTKNPRSFYKKIRGKFNMTGRPDYFLYLLARCVKGSVRYNANGEFNQSPDNRRKGMRPDSMRNNINRVSSLLKNRTILKSKNYRDIFKLVNKNDLIYMDPPYQGVCGNKDTRYLANIQFCEFITSLEELNQKDIKYIVSYDGRTGSKIHGKKLPAYLNLLQLDIEAGRSSQETLLGRKSSTIESLYLSPALLETISSRRKILTQEKQIPIEACL